MPLVYCPLHFSSNDTDHSSTIIQGCALILTTQSEKHLVVDSVDSSENCQEQACTVASAAFNFPTDGQYLAQVLTSVLGCEAVSSK